MPFSYSAVWDDTVRMLRSHSSLIVAIAGVFIFLPTLLIAYFLPQEEAQPQQVIAQFLDYVSANFHWLLLGRLVEMVGTIAILLLVFRPAQLTVGAAIGRGVALLPFYFISSLASGLIILAGLLLLLVPGLYLLGRLATIGVVVVVEDRRNPIDAVRRSFEVTKGRGWTVLGLVLIVFIAGIICIGALVAVIGALLLLLAGPDLGAMLILILRSLANTALVIVLILLVAAVYRQLVSDNG
jgi:hypothetical protein